MKPLFFASAGAFRAWLRKNHDTATEVWAGFHRKASGRAGIAYQEALDEALCFGWIDGIRKSLGEAGYTNRFSPRKARSVWSTINIARVRMLSRAGRMHPSGLAVFRARDPKRSGIYSFENRPKAFDRESQRAFKTNRVAWTFFAGQPPGYRRTATFFVMSAKKEETRARRLARLMDDSARGRRLGSM